ncbi:hypothetical protein GCM10023170_016270 [Phytohabitans houttuyneae]
MAAAYAAAAWVKGPNTRGMSNRGHDADKDTAPGVAGPPPPPRLCTAGKRGSGGPGLCRFGSLHSLGAPREAAVRSRVPRSAPATT